MTTDSNENPAYGVLELDAATMLPLNYQMYALNITKANERNEAEWELMIDYVKDYGIKDFPSPDEMYDLAVRMKTDRELASLFSWDRSRKANEKGYCDEGCGKGLYC